MTMKAETKLEQKLTEKLGMPIGKASDQQLYGGLLSLVRERAGRMKEKQGSKKVYYISAEFLIGKLLSNNLINLGIYEEVEAILREHGKELSLIEEMEPEPSLGNGGLGRLAACFLDSMATLGLNGAGIGLNYHYGLFRQVFKDRKQTEEINPWLEKESWLRKRDICFDITFKNFILTSRLYDIDVLGYGGNLNQLHLFDVETLDETMVKAGIRFDKTQIAGNLTLFLYPDDSDKAGELLRIYQQYFMVSSGAQLILKEMEENGHDLHKLHEHAVIQINDTHPSMIIPELIRLLTIRGIGFEEAVRIVSQTCAYTNHTILAEALEKWPVEYLEEVVPALIPIIRTLDQMVRVKYPNEKVAIIDEDDRVHMAHMDMHYGFSVNGVAALHTEILKQSELKDFYAIYPEKFNNKTNGITFRRWLMLCNRKLAGLITDRIGDGWKEDAGQLERLSAFISDETMLDRLLAIKQDNKLELKRYLYETQGITLNENSIFDIQIKRLHEYKRQQMNVLYVIHKYLEIKNGQQPATPITVIFGAKAAPAYRLAKDIIHLILCLQELIERDPIVSPYLRVVMVENYNVTKAEKLIPACDISEQISLASKEASGTGNMKFMLNGAITLGTMDGANVEICEQVGRDNIYIFGASSETVIKLYEEESYHAADYYRKDQVIKQAVDFIISDAMLKLGDSESLARVHKEITGKDWFMTLLDLKDYIEKKDQAFADYEDRMAWAGKMLINISKAGYFSSDRTIAQYNEEIWKLK